MSLSDRLRAIVAPLPSGASVVLPVTDLVAWLAEEETAVPQEPREPAESPPLTWRERLWTVPAETRLGIAEVAEALGRSRSWIYKETSSGDAGLPYRKLGGELVFVAEELRAWMRAHEERHGDLCRRAADEHWATRAGGSIG